jgi:hypothetical protein
MNPTVELVLKHKKSNMRKSEFLMLEALKSAPHLNDNSQIQSCRDRYDKSDGFVSLFEEC